MSPTTEVLTELGQGSLGRALDNALAERLIASQFAEIGPPRITGRYDGMDHHAVEIDDAWIFRFLKRAECEPMLLRGLKLLPHIEGLIPMQVPAYRCIGKPTPECPWTFAGCRKLAGTPASSCGAWRSMAEHGGAWRSMAEHGGA